MSVDNREIDTLVRRLYEAGLTAETASFGQWALRQAGELLALEALRWSRENERGESVAEQSFGTFSPNADPDELLRIAVTGAQDRALHRFEVQVPASAPLDLETLKRLAHYLVHAEWIHDELARTRSAGALRRNDAHAMLGAQGSLLRADRAFRNLLLQAHPRWQGDQLPFEIDWDAAGSRTGQAVGPVRVFASRYGDVVELRARAAPAEDLLSPREIEVARLIARGRTFKEAARELDVAPSTVSTHLYSLYAKLQIKGRAELIDWLSEQRDWI